MIPGEPRVGIFCEFAKRGSSQQKDDAKIGSF